MAECSIPPRDSVPRSMVIAPEAIIDDVYDPETLCEIKRHSHFLGLISDPANLHTYRKTLAKAEVIFSTWGMPVMDEEFFSLVPSLRAVFYAAGGVKCFVTDEVWKRDITICSAWRANAISVAEFTLGAILLSLKQVWAYQRRLKQERAWGDTLKTSGAYRSTVGLVSLGAIGWRVAKLLRQFDVNIIASDPYADAATAAAERIQLIDLEELFERSDVVSIHVPWLKETEKLIHGDLICRLKPYSTLINTSRGAVVDENDLIEVLRERPDLTALLDVTYPEPPVANSPLYSLPNVQMTPHIAGSIGRERRRLGRCMLDEYLRLLSGKPLEHRIYPEALATLA